jgi:hypothetical protein
MIRLRRLRTVEDIHPDFTGGRLLAKLITLAEQRIAFGKELEFTGPLGDWKKAKDALKRHSFGKCAYCEANTATVAHGDVEHFRPKSVYWWLALCIDNYVYACQICNQSYKRDEFPIHGKRLKGPALPRVLPKTPKARERLAAKISPDPLRVDESKLIQEWLIEDPGLPHPYLEDPEELFAWAVVETNGEIHLVEPRNASVRSKNAVQAVVDYLGLNRETLLKLRYAVYSDLKFALEVWRSSNDDLRDQAAAHVRHMCADERPFAGMCRHFCRLAKFV